MSGFFYIMANKRNGTLYKGVANDLARRVGEHRAGKIKGFSQKYGTRMLVYYEKHDQIEDAIQRERNIEGWLRKWKLELIESVNPDWRDLYGELIDLSL